MPLWKALAEVFARYGVEHPEHITRVHFDVNEGWAFEVTTIDVEVEPVDNGFGYAFAHTTHYLSPRMEEVI